MGYAALIVAITGFAVGMRFRVTALLPIIVLLLLVSILVPVLQSFSFLHTALVTILAQIIIQSCYFLGVVARAALTGLDRPPRVKKHEPRLR
jgi:hypothetical protein